MYYYTPIQNNVRLTEVGLKWKSLNSGDVFVLDLGLHLIQVYMHVYVDFLSKDNSDIKVHIIIMLLCKHLYCECIN